MKVAALYLFPVKSLAAVAVQSFICSEAGPLFDREWMVVDSAGKFLTQRELPKMALVQPMLDLKIRELRLSASGKVISCSLSPASKLPQTVNIWGEEILATDLGEEMAQFLSAFLGKEVRLMRILPGMRVKTGENARELRFVDDYPLHIASLSSLSDLNQKLSLPLEILRFRPNIVLEGALPWAEDSWTSVKIGANIFTVGRACTRCAITTVDPSSGEKGQEPLKTLAGFRRNAKNKIEFGLYLHSVDKAEIAVGMNVLCS